MPDLYPIIADSSALLGLASCESEYSDLVFTEIGITTTWTCFKEVRDKSRNSGDHWVRKSANRIMDYVDNGDIPYPTRVNIPGSPTAGGYNAGEESIRIALGSYDCFSDVIIYDDEAVTRLERTQKELSGTDSFFEIEPPNFPLFLLTLRGSGSANITVEEFDDQSELLLQRMGWKGSSHEDQFWKYPV